jgi:hypothetical protein
VYQNLAEVESANKTNNAAISGACNHLNGWEIIKLLLQFKILII